MQDYKKLVTWQKAHLLAVAIYQATAKFPKEEVYGFTSQIRRACISIPSNIAEGCGREGNSEFNRFLQIALGSAKELEYQLLLAKELNYLDIQSYKNLDDQATELRKMLITLIKRVKN